MSTDRDTTRIVRSWLRTDEHESADRVLDAVLDQLHTTPQRRARWPARRFPSMNQAMRIAVATAAVVAVALLGLRFLPIPNTGGGPSPTASAAWIAFSSERYGYSIEHPADWRVLEQAGRPMSRMEPGSPGTDTIASASAARYGSDDGSVVIWADELQEGESLDQFTARASSVTDCATALPAQPTTLDGELARKHSFSCGTWDWIQVTAIHGDRGYVVWLVTTVPPSPQDRPINDQFLATFRFTD